jgi:hypothetical protein
LAELNRQLQNHREEIREERDIYYKKRELARSSGDSYLSLIVDGADQSAYQLPWFWQRTKATSQAARLKLHLTGVIAHGIGAFVYTTTEKWAADSSLTIEVPIPTPIDIHIFSSLSAPAPIVVPHLNREFRVCICVCAYELMNWEAGVATHSSSYRV